MAMVFRWLLALSTYEYERHSWPKDVAIAKRIIFCDTGINRYHSNQDKFILWRKVSRFFQCGRSALISVELTHERFQLILISEEIIPYIFMTIKKTYGILYGEKLPLLT